MIWDHTQQSITSDDLLETFVAGDTCRAKHLCLLSGSCWVWFTYQGPAEGNQAGPLAATTFSIKSRLRNLPTIITGMFTRSFTCRVQSRKYVARSRVTTLSRNSVCPHLTPRRPWLTSIESKPRPVCVVWLLPGTPRIEGHRENHLPLPVLSSLGRLDLPRP